MALQNASAVTFSPARQCQSDKPLVVGVRQMKNLFVRFVREEEGQDLIEYSLLAAIIAVGSIIAMGTVSDELDATFADIVTGLQTR
jgi:pilus assembly protein Flp/PilA